MQYGPDIHRRRSIRLRGYDYAQAGEYFVTIVTQGRALLFGTVANCEMRLNAAGRMVQEVWTGLSVHYHGVATDAFVVMPNHIHGIVILEGLLETGQPQGVAPTGVGPAGIVRVGAGPRACPGSTTEDGQPEEGETLRGASAERLGLPNVVHRFKTLTTKRYADGVRHQGWPTFERHLWQRNYYEHIARNEDDLARVREYVSQNVMKWAEDAENPEL